MFVRLTCALSNRPLYLNPAHVVSVNPWRDSRGDDPEYTAVAMTDDAGAAPGQAIRRVLEPIDEVVRRLESAARGESFGPQADTPGPDRVSPTVADGDVLTAAERLAIANAINAWRLASLADAYDFNLLLDLYSVPDELCAAKIPTSALEKAAADCERIAATHPDATTREGYAARAARYRRNLESRS